MTKHRIVRNLGLVLIAMCAVTVAASAQSSGYSDGMPFGYVGPKDVDRLRTYASKEGVDLIGDLERAYQKDDEALARVFAFSLKFKKLDRNAKTYGHLVVCSFLNMGESTGVGKYSRVVAAQPEEVRQRIRDFIFFPTTQVPPQHQKEAAMSARKTVPLLFPNDYVFGAGNSLFKTR